MMPHEDESFQRKFLERVSYFLQQHEGLEVQKVLKVLPCGNDWDGSTEDGFRQSFSCSVTYLDNRGIAIARDYKGEDLQRMWQVVVQGESS